MLYVLDEILFPNKKILILQANPGSHGREIDKTPFFNLDIISSINISGYEICSRQ